MRLGKLVEGEHPVPVEHGGRRLEFPLPTPVLIDRLQPFGFLGCLRVWDLGSHVGLDSTDSSVVCFFIAVSSCLCQAISLVGEVDPNVKTKA